MGVPVEADYTTDSTSNHEKIRSGSHSLHETDPDEAAIPEKQHDEAATEPSSSQIVYSQGFRLAIIMCTINLTTLIAALDLGIVATAIPGITDDFHNLDLIGWYSGCIFLTVATTSPMWGKLFTYFPAPTTYMSALVLYLIGSIIAAAAPNSIALIIGRAIQGWGCSGTLGGSAVIINLVAEPKRRPLLLGLWVGTLMFATIIGPLIGGVFTTELTWRWCFWINLPIGGTAIVLQLLFLRVQQKPAKATWKEILLQLDLPGFSILLVSLICFTLSLQWGGLSKPWSDGSVIATLVLWVVLTITFFVVEWMQGPYAMIPLNLIKSRIIWANCLWAVIANIANFQIMFLLPIYFQSIKGASAIKSGIDNLPTVAFFALGAILGGGISGKTRLLQPIQLVSGIFAVIGAALLYNLDVNSSKAWYIGAQIPLGFGIGFGNQVPITALQSFTKPKDMPTMMGIAFMCNPMGGAYFVLAAQSLFSNRLLQRLAQIAPSMDAEKVLHTGASELRQVFSGGELASVIDAYMTGLKDVFAFAMAGAALTALFSLLIPFKRIPDFDLQKKAEDQEAEEKKAAAQS